MSSWITIFRRIFGPNQEAGEKAIALFGMGWDRGEVALKAERDAASSFLGDGAWNMLI
jgi:hypothetical protein